jgi:REP element-mobilizing transposase RayT
MPLFRKPGDYDSFERAIEKTLETCPLRICAYLLMPDHRHFVVWPERGGGCERHLCGKRSLQSEATDR